MKRFITGFILFCIALIGIAGSALAELSRYQVSPTLVPPTLVPTIEAGVNDVVVTESTLARVTRNGLVRAGVLYTAPPFGSLNIRGEAVGYDVDLARSLAEAWGVQLDVVQVTRQTAIEMLKTGVVDMLVAAQIHRRDLDTQVEFSHTYYGGSQAMIVRLDDGAARLADMTGRKVGYVLGSASADSVALWTQRTAIQVTLQTYLTLDQALGALVIGEVDGIVDSRVSLLQRLSTQPNIGKILEETVSAEPYAIAILRQDINWRNLINKTLQYLVHKGRMQEIQQAYFPGTRYPLSLVPVWANIGDEAPQLDQFSDDILYPAQNVVPRIQQTGVIRVAGVTDVASDAPESERRYSALNRAMVESLAAMWDMRADYLPNSGANAIELVIAGQADLAAGIALDWAYSDRVDLSAPYLLHGERVLAKKDDVYETFSDLRGRWVGVFATEPGAADRVNDLASSANSGVRIFTIGREQDAAAAILDQASADVAFGDSLKLIPFVQAQPDQFRLTTRANSADPWYSRVYVGFAVPRNDVDFRLLVEYSMQELARSGQWQAMLEAVMLPEDIPAFDIWPGSSEYLGFKLS